MSKQTIYLASDHRGVGLKAALGSWLKEKGLEPHDLGPSDATSCNASDYAVKLATAMRADPDARGVLICGTGQAMAMTANRFAHLRAALCLNGFMARLAREHNDANVLVLGAELVGEGLALDIVQTFFTTEALGGKYADRCKILTNLGGL
jgi:ribose 5-phosphate isomerase B